MKYTEDPRSVIINHSSEQLEAIFSNSAIDSRLHTECAL